MGNRALRAVVNAMAFAALLSPAALSYSADPWLDLLRKGADAAIKELNKPQSPPPSAPAGRERPASSPAPTPQAQPAPQAVPAAPGPVSQPAVAQQPAKPPELHPDEIGFVAPSATTKLSDTERCFSLDENEIDTKVLCPPRKRLTDAELRSGPPRDAYPINLPNISSPRVIVANPYLAPDTSFFNRISGMACDAGGGLWLSATAFRKRNGASYASGLWRVAPDGQITPLSVKPFALEIQSRYPYCNAPFRKTNMTAEALFPLTPSGDGGMFTVSGGSSILKIQPDGMITRFAGDDVCTSPDKREQGYADGSLAEAKFKGILSVLTDPQGAVWVGEDVHENCTLRRISDGRVTTVLTPERVCPKGDPLNFIVFEHLAWDPVRSELVAAGMHLWRGPPTGDDYISSVWRISLDGSAKRVFLSRALRPGGAARPGTLSSMTVDRHGDILIALTREENFSATQIQRIDAHGRVSVVSGAPRRPTNVTHADGPAREAIVNNPSPMCLDSQGSLFLKEGHSVIRKMTPDGRVTTWVY